MVRGSTSVEPRVGRSPVQLAVFPDGLAEVGRYTAVLLRGGRFPALQREFQTSLCSSFVFLFWGRAGEDGRGPRWAPFPDDPASLAPDLAGRFVSSVIAHGEGLDVRASAAIRASDRMVTGGGTA